MIAGRIVRLVPLDRQHLDATLRWANDPELMRLLDRARHVEAAEHQEWFARIRGRDDCAYFAIESPDGTQHLGNVWLWGIDLRHRRAELRIVMDRQATGAGAGTESIDLLCRFGFDELNLHKVFAYVLDINPRARRAFEKAGFELEGVLKEDRWSEDHWLDVWLLGRRR